MLNYLPENLKTAIQKYDLSTLNEIRLRVNKPVFLQCGGKYFSLKEDIIFNSSDMEGLFLRLTKRSVYVFQDNIRNGYLVGENGERVGIIGKCVYSNGELKNVADITSVCIRIPHEVIGVADMLIDGCFQGGVKSVIVISPPGVGKTTFLRDAARLISTQFACNILVIDEKGEFSGNGRFNLGKTTDVLLYGKKNYGFNQGVLNMRPDVIICDELFNYEDIDAARNAVLSGIRILASAHAKSIEELSKKDFFKKILKERIFDYAVVLSGEKRLGTVENVIKL